MKEAGQSIEASEPPQKLREQSILQERGATTPGKGRSFWKGCCNGWRPEVGGVINKTRSPVQENMERYLGDTGGPTVKSKTSSKGCAELLLRSHFLWVGGGRKKEAKALCQSK